jgi:predicted amidophosphoribosyltransferase
MEVTAITETRRSQQQRFFCDNCQREVFLQAKYCDKCGGEIEWPKEIRKVIGSWEKEEKKAH